jgi:hypothetical protein
MEQGQINASFAHGSNSAMVCLLSLCTSELCLNIITELLCADNAAFQKDESDTHCFERYCAQFRRRK